MNTGSHDIDALRNRANRWRGSGDLLRGVASDLATLVDAALPAVVAGAVRDLARRGRDMASDIADEATPLADGLDRAAGAATSGHGHSSGPARADDHGRRAPVRAAKPPAIGVAARLSPLFPDGDPTPGDVSDVRLMVARLRRAAVAAHRVLRVAEAGRPWANAPRRQVITTRLEAARDAYGRCADVLEAWAERLEAAQAEAANLAVRAGMAARTADYPPGPVPPALSALRQRHAALATHAHSDAQRCARELKAVIADVELFGAAPVPTSPYLPCPA